MYTREPAYTYKRARIDIQKSPYVYIHKSPKHPQTSPSNGGAVLKAASPAIATRTRISTKEPYTYTKETYIYAKEPYTYAKEPYIYAKEPYIYPHTSRSRSSATATRTRDATKEPLLYTKESCIQKKVAAPASATRTRITPSDMSDGIHGYV